VKKKYTPTSDDIIQFSDGLKMREALAHEVLESEIQRLNFKNKKTSIAREHFKENFRESDPELKGKLIELTLISIAHSRNTIEEVEDFFSEFRFILEDGYLGHLALGGRLRNPNNILQNGIESKLDFSLVFQSWLNRELLDGALDEAGTQLLNSVSALTKMLFNKPVRTFSAFSTRYHELGLNGKYENLAGFLAQIQNLKKKYWSLVGVDIFYIFEFLLDPFSLLDDGFIKYGKTISKLYNLEVIFLKLVAFRIVAEGELDKYENAMNDDFFAPLYSTLHVDIVEVLKRYFTGKEEISPLSLRLSTDHFTKLLIQMLNIKIAMLENDVIELDRNVVDLYELDELAPSHVNWNIVHNIKSSAQKYASIERCFVGYLLGKEYVRKKYKAVAFARSSGEFVSSIRFLLRGIRQENDGVHDFMLNVKKLPKRAEADFMREFLKVRTLKRVSSLLPQVILTDPSNLQRIDDHRSSVRFNLAERAEKLNIISVHEAELIKTQEREFHRLQYFYLEERHGLIKIKWDKWEQDILGMLQLEYNFRSKDVSFILGRASADTSENEERFQDNIGRYISRKIVEWVLFRSPGALDRVLSDNIRHTNLEPRFVRSFNEGIQGIFSDESLNVTFEEQVVEELLGENFLAISALRTAILAEIKNFMTSSLSVNTQGELQIRLLDEITYMLKSHDSNRGSADHLAENILNKIKSIITQKIDSARREMKHELGPSLHETIDSFRPLIKEHESYSVSRFFENLEEDIKQAIYDSMNWIRISEETGPVDDFEIKHLLKYELGRLYLSKPANLYVRSQSLVYDKKTSKFREQTILIKGEYLQVIDEIIRNLLNNAIEHSGLDLKTDVQFTFIVHENHFTMKCVNSLTDAKFAEAKVKHASVVHGVKTETGEASGKDKKSGFPKIINKCFADLECSPIINIPPLGEETNRYTVEVILRNCCEMLVSDDANISS